MGPSSQPKVANHKQPVRQGTTWHLSFPSVDWTLSGINHIVSGSGQLQMQL